MLNRIHKQLEYPLPATTITKKKLDKLSGALYKVSLPKCGIIRKFPLRFRTLPSQFFGLDLPDLYLEMQIKKIKEVLQNYGQSTIMGEQLQYGLETAQIEAGQKEFILNADYKKFSVLVTDSWIKHIWKFISDNKMTMKGWKHHFKPQRENDEFIMIALIKFGMIKSELKRMNECRKYLQVITISDITDGSGNKLSECYLNGIRDKSRVSKYKWQNKKKPTLGDWYLWDNNIRKIFCTTDLGRYLKKPLGKWINNTSQEWSWYKHPHLNILYHHTDNIVRTYTPSTSKRSSKRQGLQWYTVREILDSTDIPHNAHKATVTNNSRSYEAVEYDGAMMMNTNIPDIEFNPLQFYEKDEWSFLRYHTLSSVTRRTIEEMSLKGIRIVADGSYKQSNSSFGLIIETIDMSMKIVATGMVPANSTEIKDNTDPYRSKIMGLYVGMKIWSKYEDIIQKPTNIILSCDNEKTLEVTSHYTHWNASMKHFDLVSSVISVRNSLMSTIESEHVLGHADVKKRNRKATRLELLNQACDKLAKYTRTTNKPIDPVHFAEENLSIWIGNQKLYSAISGKIRYHHQKKKASYILSAKFGWKMAQFHMVHWETNQKAMSMLHKTKQIWISKFITGFLPIGINMERRSEWKQTHCPRCLSVEESRIHLAKCTEDTSVECFQNGLQTIHAWMKVMDTPQRLTEAIVLNITLWHGNAIPQIHHTSPLRKQVQLGAWDHFMEGKLHIHLIEYMDQHYEDTASKRTGVTWASQLISKIWTLFFFKQWEIRNQFVHNHTDKTKISRQREDTQFRVREEYGTIQKSSLLVKDQPLLEISLSKLLLSTNDALISWLKEIKLAKRDRDEFYQAPKHNQSTGLRQWLQSDRCSVTSPIPNNPDTWSIKGTKMDLRRGSWKPP